MVRTRTIDLAKETFWREQMERQLASGLGIAAWLIFDSAISELPPFQ